MPLSLIKHAGVSACKLQFAESVAFVTFMRFGVVVKWGIAKYGGCRRWIVKKKTNMWIRQWREWHRWSHIIVIHLIIQRNWRKEQVIYWNVWILWGIMLRKKKKVLCGSCLELTISLHFRGMVLNAIMDLIFIFMDLQLSITTWWCWILHQST